MQLGPSSRCFIHNKLQYYFRGGLFDEPELNICLVMAIKYERAWHNVSHALLLSHLGFAIIVLQFFDHPDRTRGFGPRIVNPRQLGLHLLKSSFDRRARLRGEMIPRFHHGQLHVLVPLLYLSMQ